MAKKLSESRKKEVVAATSRLYSATCEEVGWSREKLMIDDYAEPHERKLTVEARRELKEKIDSIYCDKIIQLPTDILEDILTAHKCGQIRRAPRTLDMIQKELLERAMNEESNTS